MDMVPHLVDKIESLEAIIEANAHVIHYPECWDTMCYETAYDAYLEIGIDNIVFGEGFNCTNEDCKHV